jgi:hypothetical protein
MYENSEIVEYFLFLTLRMGGGPCTLPYAQWGIQNLVSLNSFLFILCAMECVSLVLSSVVVIIKNLYYDYLYYFLNKKKNPFLLLPVKSPPDWNTVEIEGRATCPSKEQKTRTPLM